MIIHDQISSIWSIIKYIIHMTKTWGYRWEWRRCKRCLETNCRLHTDPQAGGEAIRFLKKTNRWKTNNIKETFFRDNNFKRKMNYLSIVQIKTIENPDIREYFYLSWYAERDITNEKFLIRSVNNISVDNNNRFDDRIKNRFDDPWRKCENRH